MLDLTRLPEAELSAFVARQPWFRAHGREGAAARVLEATFVHTVAPLLAIALVEVATERGLNEIYQLPVGLRPRVRPRSTGRRDRVDRRLDGLRRALGSRARGRARRPRPHRRERAHRRLRHRVPAPDRARRAACSRLRRAPADRRGPFEHLGRRRRGDRAQGLPAARTRRQSGARAAALPDGATASRTRRSCSAPTSTRPPDRRDARRPHPLRPGRVRRLDIRALLAGGRSRLASSSGSSGSAR